MAGSHIGRGKSDPFRIPPEVGQFSHDSGGRSFFELAFRLVHNGGGGRMDSVDVLQKHAPRTAIGGDSDNFKEEPAALAVKSSAPAGNGEVLARKSRNDAIHCSTPSASVEGEKVGPDRSAIQGAFCHARRQDTSGKCFPLDVTEGASLDAQVSEPGSQSFAKHPHAGAEFDGIESQVMVHRSVQ